MAITDTRPQSEATSSSSDASPVDQGGLAEVFGSGDHKTIGRLYIGASLIFGVGAFVLAALYVLEGLDADLLPDDWVFRVFTLSQLSVVLLFLVPLALGIAMVVVPLQIGASTLAFARGAAASFWTWLAGAGLLLASYATDGGPDGTDPQAVSLFYLALAGILGGLILASISVATTAFTQRAAGMTLWRAPLFTWSMIVACSAWILSLSVLVGNLVLIWVDLKYGTADAFTSAQWPQIAWLIVLPQVFIVAIPALGAISETVASFAGVRQAHRALMMHAIAAFGVFTIAPYAQAAFVEPIRTQPVYVLQSLLLIVPAMVLAAGWIHSVMVGKVKLSSPALTGLFGTVALVVAVLLSAPFVLDSLQLQDASEFLENLGQLADAMVGSSIYSWGVAALAATVGMLGAAAALLFWSPKISGRRAADGLGKLAGLLLLVGGLLHGLPLLLVGLGNELEPLADASDVFFVASAGGAALVVVGLLAVAVALLGARGTDEPAAWGVGQTLEWATASPPARGNFATQPSVDSAEPLLDETGKES